MRLVRPILIAGLLALYVVFGLLPAWEQVRDTAHARDYATFHYAAQEAWSGGDPYQTRELGQRARDEGTRHGVHPYFYPPPFLAGMLWAVPLSLEQGYRALFWLDQLVIVGLALVFRRWLGAPWLVLALLLGTYSPIPDNNKMGQVNLVVMLLACLGLWRRSGVLVAAAAMAKMSPALYLVLFALRRRWRAVLSGVLAAVLMTLAVLWLVHPAAQLRFYTEILPGFSRGDYHGLRVPITLPANHSIADLYNQLWGPKRFRLPEMAQAATSATVLALLAVVAWAGRRARDTLGEAALAGALTVVLVVAPVYTYEHHLAFLVLPWAVVGTALWTGRLPRTAAPLVALSYLVVAWPLWALRGLQERLPGALEWWLQESKFFGVIGLLLLCLWTLRRSPVQDGASTA